jgi:hypothetical protein
MKKCITATVILLLFAVTSCRKIEADGEIQAVVQLEKLSHCKEELMQIRSYAKRIYMS